MSDKLYTEDGPKFDWRVTMTEGQISLEAGEKLSKFDSNTTVHVIGKSLINLGSRLLSSEVSEDDEFEDEDE